MYSVVTHNVSAQSVDEIRSKITENNKKIEELQSQIDQYSSLLNSTSKEATTLKNALKTLELTQKKLETDLSLTTTRISKTTLTLTQLRRDIAETENKIDTSAKAVAVNLRSMSMAESQSAIEELLNNKSISDTWDYVNALHTVGAKIKNELETLRDLRMTLGAKRDQVEGERNQLQSFQKTLAAEREVVESTKVQKDKLLKDTQNKESEYKAILTLKSEQKEEFEKELFTYESQLKVTLDPSAIPNARSGVLSWPMSNVSITQYFGKTVSARRLYTSGTHGGIDLRAAIGSPIKAALSGTVTDTEAVKARNGCQYGKYVLIRHPNGLSTIYGHLASVTVKPGDTVLTGDMIGLSGDTGYATGPHLHFGVYATAGVRVVDSSSLGSGKCAGIKTVAAPPSAYLDPMAYLPKP